MLNSSVPATSAALPRNPDLHCHSSVSDGLLPPAEVVKRAHANGVDLLALTDHDELSGLDEARETAASLGLRFVNGVEVSVTRGSATLHIVGLGIDPNCEVLQQGLKSVRDGRQGRALAMAASLEKIGIRNCYEGAIKYARNPALVGRSHFARYLVEIGICREVHEVFRSYLTPGKPGYVPHQWSELSQAVSWIRAAGGIPVMAHPGRYRMSREQMDKLLAEFVAQGGLGIEVVAGSHNPEQEREFARLARKYSLLASRASDFHGPGESLIDLGCANPLPEDLTPVWSRLL